MADINQQEQEVLEPPQTNGVLDGLTEEEKSKMRPADIDADMREMERRKRVEMMMNSRLFREELERIIETQMKDGAGPSGLLQQISEMMGPQGARFNTNVFRNSNCVVPINDIRGVESMGYAKGEKLLRCKLASVFRLLDLYGWTQGVGGMITARLNQDQEHFLINPYGLLYHEVTASSLVKVDMQGGVVEQGTTNFGVHIAGYQLHSTIHAARPDIKCIVHIATPSVTAISSTKCGLLPLDQESIVIGEVSNHHYISSSNLDPEEREKLTRNFGPINKVMLLTNRGALCCGETVEEAFFNVYNTVLACETQLKLMPVGIDNLSLLSDEARKAIYESSRKAPVPQHSSVAEPSPLAEKLEKRWRIGGTEFEALMRMLDNAGFRTGYIYRHPLVKSEPPRPRNDVEVPPAVSSLGYLLEEEELYKQGLWKGGRKGTDRTRWLNSPNVYQKVEILETGTPDPKKITKWVSDDSPTHNSTPVKIDGALQFVPKNTNPKEFKQLQQQIKDYRRADKISAGPQSHILEGVTWEEAKKMQDATISGTGEQVVLVGAASKGIIQRGFQHNATVYKTPYAKNPFDAVTDQELDQYKKEIERKTKGDPYDESQSESEALSSFNISRVTHESSTAKSPIQSPVSVTSETEEESRDEPRVLRIETKQVPAPSQPEVVLSDVNADFLNEQRRSEAMLRRSANGRGISGVSRLSSSRSNSSSEDLEPWPGCYEACRLETARAQEFARPTKVLITEIQKVSTISRKMRQDFFKNYERRLNNKYPVVENKDKLYVINTLSKFESTRAKFDVNVDNLDLEIEFENKKSVLKAVVSDIQIGRNADMKFAEKVNLLVDRTVSENSIYNVNDKCEKETASSPIIIKLNIRNNNYKEFNEIRNNFGSAESLLDCTLKVFSDNEVEDKKNKELNANSEIKTTDYIKNINNNKNTDIYVNEVEFCVSNDSNEVDRDNFETHSKKYNNKGVTEVQNNNDENSIKTYSEKYNNKGIIEIQNNNYENSTNTSDKNKNSTYNYNIINKEEIINYVNEVEFSIHDTLNVFSEQVTKNINEEPEKYVLEIFELPSPIDSHNRLNVNTNVDKEQIENQMKKKSLICDNSTPFNIDTIEKNQLDASLNVFLKNETINYTLDQDSDDITRTIKDSEKTNDLLRNVHKKESDEIGNVWLTGATDDTEKLSKIIPNSLDFTYSEIDKFSEDISPTSTTRESFFSDDDLVMKRITRRDSITEVVSSINSDIKPSNKVIVDMLADTENSIKYNLDSQNMSLIYSITPTNDIGDSSKNTTIEDILEDNENDYVTQKNCNDNDEIIPVSCSNNIEIREININKTIEFSDHSFASNISNQGSDLLELPSHTYLDLQKSSDEIFQKNMSTSVNQIIHELNDAELFVNAANFVDEIIYDVACLNLPCDISKFSKLELRNFIQEKIWALNFVKKIAKDLVGNLQYYDADKSTNSKVSNNNEDSSWVESIDQSVYIIRELIHHVIDKDNLGKCDYKCKKTITDKKAKEFMNIELKGLKDDYDATDEKNIMCSTPKLLLSPSASENNSFSKDQTILDVDNGNTNQPIIEQIEIYNEEHQQISEVPVSSNSSPSTESQNFAEQEVTSESTDNDTKSDSSKEKQINILEETINKQIFSNVQETSEITSNCPITRVYNQNNELTQLDTSPSKLRYCVIEYTNEGDGHLKNTPGPTNSGISADSLTDKTYTKENEQNHLSIVSNNFNYCVLEYESKNDVHHESTPNINYEDKVGTDTDSNDSIKSFMQKFMDYEEEIDQLWRGSEAKFEEIYAAERLDEIIHIAEDILSCEENIHRTCKTGENEVPSILSDREEKSVTSIYSNKYDDANKEQLQFETVGECCSYFDLLKMSDSVENAEQSSLLINESELESVNNVKSTNLVLESVNTFERLTPIFEVSELNLSCDEYVDYISDTKTSEFYSCQNSLSFKSWDEQETIDSTFNVSVDANSDYDKTYSADISANDVSLDFSTVGYRLEETKGNNYCDNETNSFSGVLNVNSLNDNSEVITLEYMTSSYETKEFIQIEMACNNSSEFSDVEKFSVLPSNTQSATSDESPNIA